MIEKQVDSLLSQRIIKNQNEPKILVIGAIDDKTSQNIDIEIVTTEIMKHLSNSGKFVIVNAGRDANIEKIIRNSRKFRNDAEYNQYTTIEQGNLISPHYALTGKITEMNKTIGDDKIKEYVFALTFTDLKTGAHPWVGAERISKKLPKSEVLQSYSSNRSYRRSYSYSQDDDSDSWESVKEFFSFGAEGRNHFIFGADFGLGAVGINLPPIDFTIIEKYNPGYGKPTIKSIQHGLYIDDFYSTAFSMPLNVRIGYLRDIGDNWAFGLNFLYNYNVVAFDAEGLKDTTSFDIESNSKKLTHTVQRIGGELLIYYKALDWLHIYVGGGALKDFGSKYKLSFEARRGYSWSSYDYFIDKEGQRRFELEQKIDSWYPLVKVGILWNFHSYIGAISDVTCSWALKEENYLGVNCALVLGLQLKI